VTNKALNALFAASWPDHTHHNLTHTLGYSLTYICAYQDEQLIGFVNVAWDGDIHAFLLNPTVHPDLRHQGIGSELVRRAANEARDRGIVWLHVDYEPALEPFYRQCGFQHTEAGLMRLQIDKPNPTVEHAEDLPVPSSVVRLHKTAQSHTLDCRRCRSETIHTWTQWRPWYLALSRRQWLEGWACERCGARRFVWRVKRRRRH
jgi:GNAT superfamily N-acetyltransferase